jgi:preprotein translocase subunit SecE
MNEQVQEQLPDGPLDKVKLIAAVALVIAGIAAFYVLGEQRPEWQRWLVMVAGLALGIVVFLTSGVGRRFWTFVLDSRIELRKVVWPSRQETMQTTLVVMAFVAIAGVFFWGLDVLLTWLTNKLTGTGV